MRAVALVLAIATTASVAAPAFAQRLPRTSPAERRVDDLNRSIQRQQRRLSEQQQDQIEINQLRQELSRQRTTPQISPGIGRICAPGQIAC
jgi:uncharacterized membrane protein YgcG